MEARVQDSLKRIDVEASNLQRELEKSHIRKLQVGSGVLRCVYWW